MSGGGVRFELKRRTEEDARVEYDLSAALPDAEFLGSARIDRATGAVAFAWSGPEAPAWIQELVRAQLRTLYRESMTGKAFPRRITRWREEK